MIVTRAKSLQMFKRNSLTLESGLHKLAYQTISACGPKKPLADTPIVLEQSLSLKPKLLATSIDDSTNPLFAFKKLSLLSPVTIMDVKTVALGWFLLR